MIKAFTVVISTKRGPSVFMLCWFLSYSRTPIQAVLPWWSGDLWWRLTVWESDFWPLCERAASLLPLYSRRRSSSACCSTPPHAELNHNPIKWCREEKSPYSLGFTSQSLHPNPEEMGGKWSFQPVLMDGPEPLGLRGPQSSDVLELILFIGCFTAAQDNFTCFEHLFLQI